MKDVLAVAAFSQNILGLSRPGPLLAPNREEEGFFPPWIQNLPRITSRSALSRQPDQSTSAPHALRSPEVINP